MDVWFETSFGKRFDIEVGYFDTVAEMKEKIQKYQGFPVSRQTLLFNGQPMSDDRDTEFYGILHESRIQLLLQPDKKPLVKTEESSKFQIPIKIPSSKKQFPLPIELTDTVGALKDRIQEVEGIPTSRFAIFLAGLELQECHRSLGECGVSEQSEINVVLKPFPCATGGGNNAGGGKKLKVMVQPKCGTKKIPMEVNPSDNVGELKKELQRLHHQLHLHLPQEGYFFIYKQNVMEDDRSFRWHDVRQGDTIEIFNGSVTGGS